MSRYYIDVRHPQEATLMEWAQWYEKADRHVGYTSIGKACVSTVFLGLDHNLSGQGAPILYETMVFRGSDGDEQYRYATYWRAVVGHWRTVLRVWWNRGKA